MKKRNLLDSFAVMAWLQDEKGARTVQNLLVEARRSGEKLLLHEINLAEVYYLTIRRTSEERAKSLAAQFLTLPIEVVSTTREILWDAAQIKARHSVSLADAFAAATAIQRDARVVTGDAEFKPISHLVEILWL
jgi:predicted nucleic acid-binding protein